jgi:ferrous iron transport protein B
MSPARQTALAGPVKAAPRIVLVGNPNVGKSTLFNLLTGAAQKTMNAPRTTVSLAVGRWRLGKGADAGLVQLVDLPGTYSLLAQSPDEAVTAQAVTAAAITSQDQVADVQGGCHGTDTPSTQDPEGAPDLAIVVVDAGAPASSLYLAGQMAVLGVPMVVALTMADVAKARGQLIDAERLAQHLGVPVVEVNPRKGQGAAQLGQAVSQALTAQTPPLCRVGQDALACAVDAGGGDDAAPSQAPLSLATEPLFDWVAQVIQAAQLDAPPKTTGSDRLDRVLLNPWLGMPIFFAILWAVFQLTTVVAPPAQDLCEALVTDILGGWVVQVLGLVGWSGGWFESLLVDGVLAGLGMVVSFLPLMAIIFAAIAVLEDSGYMARVALVADRLMRVVGLDGRAVLPLVIGFGCNIPALAATKTVPNSRQRLLTGLLVPYASCTARLVIFLFVASVFFPAHAGTVVFGMYLLSVAVIVLVGIILRHTGFKGVGKEPLILVLPPYQLPRIWPLVRSVLLRCRDFALRAGQVIMVLNVAVWALLCIPVASGYSIGQDIPAEKTVLGAAAKAVAPAFAPAGFDDWHVTASLMTGFVAKEAAVGTLATTYGMDEPEDPSNPGSLAQQVRAGLDRTSGGHGGAAALAYMVFCLGYTPCMATVAEQRRLFGGKPAVLAVLVSVVVSWLLAVLVFQVGALL